MQTTHDGRPESYESTEMSFSILKLFRTFHEYRWPITLATLGAAVAYGLIALTYFLLSPASVVTQLPFRFDFQSAVQGQYPNGTKFNTADVVAAPILRAVHAGNQMG